MNTSTGEPGLFPSEVVVAFEFGPSLLRDEPVPQLLSDAYYL